MSRSLVSTVGTKSPAAKRRRSFPVRGEKAIVSRMFLTQHGHLKSWFLLWNGWNSTSRMDSKPRKYRKIGGLTFINTSYFGCLSFETCGLLISRATHRAVPQTCQNSLPKHYSNIFKSQSFLRKIQKDLKSSTAVSTIWVCLNIPKHSKNKQNTPGKKKKHCKKSRNIQNILSKNTKKSGEKNSNTSNRMKWNVLEFSLMMGYNPKIPDREYPSSMAWLTHSHFGHSFGV